MTSRAHDFSTLVTYVLGSLRGSELRAFEAHLDGCSGCQRGVVELGAAKELLGDLPPELFLPAGPPPEGNLALDRAISQIRAEDEEASRAKDELGTGANGFFVVAGSHRAPNRPPNVPVKKSPKRGRGRRRKYLNSIALAAALAAAIGFYFVLSIFNHSPLRDLSSPGSASAQDNSSTYADPGTTYASPGEVALRGGPGLKMQSQTQPARPSPSRPVSASVALSKGPPTTSGYLYTITLAGFDPEMPVQVRCYDSATPAGFYTFTLETDNYGHASTASFCFSGDGPDHWVVAGGIESNHRQWFGSAPISPSGVYMETTGSASDTFTDYTSASGPRGPRMAANQTVRVGCKVRGFIVADGNSWWYRVSSNPWSDEYYAPADSFYNNGETSGSLKGTPFYDPAVPDC